MADVNEREMVLAHNQYAYTQDSQKGTVKVNVGPNLVNITNNDWPVLYNPQARKFEKRNSLDDVIKRFELAAEGYYIVLENPAIKPELEHPKEGAQTSLVDLNYGRKINIHGPVTFPLWPGQTAQVIQGHRLRSNEYLIIEVYNDEDAIKNWSSSVMKRLNTLESNGEPELNEKEKVPNLTLGQRLIIKGTEVSFYMPPTGISVVPDENQKYIRKAVTLERLEYCILLNEDGNKRYEKGPTVVFPTPTESFVEDKNGERKFKAVELLPNSGIHVKVIGDYEENDVSYKTGEELFITGEKQTIYYPRPEHAIIKYGDIDELHYGVTIPEGEGRYVLRKNEGRVELKKGPKNFLADPRCEVNVRRILSDSEVQLMYPGNKKALEINRQLASLKGNDSQNYVAMDPDDTLSEMRIGRTSLLKGTIGAHADHFDRKTDYTPPRTITLDTKYSGAVSVNVWNNFAVLVYDKSGKQRVVEGPETVLLAYDESLMRLSLSTGKPKTTDTILEQVYLQVHNNKVSDIVQVETRDLCTIDIKLSYRINFTGTDKEKWFKVDNYVKLLCDNMRSMIRSMAKEYGVKEFYKDSAKLIRDLILGVKGEDGKRPGRLFEENGMLVYDVEVLRVSLNDPEIQNLLQENQQTTIHNTLDIEQAEQEYEKTVKLEDILRKKAKAKDETATVNSQLQLEQIGREKIVQEAKLTKDASIKETAQALEHALDLTQIENKAVVAEKEREKLLEDEKLSKLLFQLRLEKEKLGSDQSLLLRKAQIDQEILAEKERQALKEQLIKTEIDAVVAKANAISPDLVAALTALGDKDVIARVAESFAPLAIIDRTSIAGVLEKLFTGTPLGDNLKKYNLLLDSTAKED